jgi:uncharacterized Zn finger protein
MKRSASFLALLILILSATAAFGQSREDRSRRFDNPLLDDVVQMTKEQMPDSTILAFLRARKTRLEEDIRAADLIALHRAGVSDRVIEYIAAVADIEGPGDDRDHDRDRSADRGDSAPDPGDDG